LQQSAEEREVASVQQPGPRWRAAPGAWRGL